LKNLKSSEFLRAIEFSNNGVSDSLTGAPAPKIFFDNLTREISKSKRKRQSISIVTIKLLPEENQIKTTKKPNIQLLKQKNQKYEKQLALISGCIKSNMRGSDFYSRIAENGFWICVQGDLEEAMKAADRMQGKIAIRFVDLSYEAQIKISFNEWARNLDTNNWIDEIDSQFF
jgi:GGDEF domain-containing protein